MACGSASLCIASGNPATYYTFHPLRGARAWGHEGSNLAAYTLTCPSASLCVGGSFNSVAFTTTPAKNGNAWSYVGFYSQGTPVVACAGTTLCIAGNNLGQVIVGSKP